MKAWAIAFGTSLFFGCAVAAVAEVPIADFARHAKHDMVKISPGGDYLAVTGIVGDRTVLGLVHLPDMKAVDINPHKREDIRDFAWVAPDRVMYTLAVHFGNIVNPQGTGELFTVKADGTDSNAIFGLRVSGKSTGTHIDQPQAERASGALVSTLRDDPLHAIIASYPWYAESVDDVMPTAYKIDLRDGRKTVVASAPTRGGDFLADHTGAVRVFSASGDDVNLIEKVYYRKDDASAWTPLVMDSGSGFIAPIMFDRRNETVYAHCRESTAICRWNPANGEIKVIWSSPDGSHGILVPTLDGQDAFAVRTLDGRPTTYLLDKTVPEASLLATLAGQFPGVDMRLVNASSDGKKIVLLAVADDDPGVFYLYDTPTRKITKLLERRPWIKPGSMAHTEPISLKARDGLPLNGFLTRPLGEATTNLPLVVMVHGGPYGVYDAWGFDPEVQLLATHGYAVLQVNFRGSGGKGSKFLVAGYREWGGKMQDDITDATRWAIEQHIADSTRICIYGSSYGGYAALEGVAKEPALYRCAIGNAGVYDLNRWQRQTDVDKSDTGRGFLHEALGADAADLAARSPLTHAGRIKAKVMLVVGGADERVPPAQGDAMRMALARAGNEPVWVYERNEGHGFYDESHVTEFYTRLLKFLDSNIGVLASKTGAGAR